MLNRVLHDEWLVDLASSKGAKYLTGARVESVKGETVTLRDGRNFHGKIIVGAGGHNDPLRRARWSESSEDTIKFVLMEGEFGDAVELHFGSMAPGGYAWVFPKERGANIGLGIQNKFSKGRSLNSQLRVSSPTMKEISPSEGLVPFRCPDQSINSSRTTMSLLVIPLEWSSLQMVQE